MDWHLPAPKVLRLLSQGVRIPWPYRHRCVAFGKLAEFAATLTKGAQVAVEGELRSHEYQRDIALGIQTTSIPQRVWGIRVDSVLKLDRAAQRASNDDSREDVPR